MIHIKLFIIYLHISNNYFYYSRKYKSIREKKNDRNKELLYIKI